jgi:cyclomaltodextrinase / maltogenic alpha-amylase / neopullulanase
MAISNHAWGNRALMGEKELAFLEKTPLADKYKQGDRAFAVLCATLPGGKPMIWNGQELGILSKTPKLRWKDSPYIDFYRKLFHAFRENPALYRGDFGRIGNSKPEAVYAFWRRSEDNRAVVVVNLADQPQRARLELGNFAGRYTELFSGESKTFVADDELALEP